MSINRICVVTNIYPDPWTIERGAFVERLVDIWTNKHKLTVDVVASRSIFNICRNLFKKKHTDINIAGSSVQYPNYLSLSNKDFFQLNLNQITRNRFLKATQKGVSRLPVPDLYYGQFLMTGGVAALHAGKKNNKPSFADIGESILTKSLNSEERKLASHVIKSLDGIACVSDALKEEVIELGANPDCVIAQHNTINTDRFYPRNKLESRKLLGLPEDEKIILFTGHFIERKGPLRVLEAMNKLEDHIPVKGVFIGRGAQNPAGKRVLHNGPVPNKEMPVWLSAADLFVLPTLHEGHCNAINEAMACGLPVLSSNIPEVASQVPPEAGILVDPNNVNAISQSIKQLMSDETLRKKMGKKALQVQLKRSSENRASVILKWMNDRLSIPDSNPQTA
jgi:teichuronic acid biosynthesis glycosyltransferase TuaC